MRSERWWTRRAAGNLSRIEIRLASVGIRDVPGRECRSGLVQCDVRGFYGLLRRSAATTEGLPRRLRATNYPQQDRQGGTSSQRQDQREKRVMTREPRFGCSETGSPVREDRATGQADDHPCNRDERRHFITVQII